MFSFPYTKEPINEDDRQSFTSLMTSAMQDIELPTTSKGCHETSSSATMTSSSRTLKNNSANTGSKNGFTKNSTMTNNNSSRPSRRLGNNRTILGAGQRSNAKNAPESAGRNVALAKTQVLNWNFPVFLSFY